MSNTATYPRRRLAFAVILMADVMDLLDSTIVNIAAPSIRNDIGGSYSTIQWFAAAYTLAFAIGLIAGGRLGDILGHRNMFVAGSFGFLIASIACSIAPSPHMLIFDRSVQGLSGALLIPQAFGMIRTMFAPDERAKAFAMFGPVMGLSAVLGPIVAGGLIDLNLFGSGWRAVFWINVPLGLVCVIGGFLLLPRHDMRKEITFDILGALLTGAAMFFLVFPLVQGREAGWPLWTYAMIGGSVALFGLFSWHELRVERRNQSPLVMPSLFRKRQFNSGMIFCALFFAMMSGLFLTVGLYCQIGLGYSALRAGFTQAPVAFGIAVGAALTGKFVVRLGRTLMLGGLTVVTIGVVVLLATLYLVGSDMHSWDFIPSLLLIGMGMGAVFGPLFNIILTAVNDNEMGSASGTINAVQQFGGALGIAIVATLFFSMIGSQAAPGAETAATQLDTQVLSADVNGIANLHNEFVNCLSASATAKDPTVLPPSCNDLKGRVAETQHADAVAPMVADQADHAIRLIFTDALKHTLWLPLLMLLIAVTSALFLPKRAREMEPH